MGQAVLPGNAQDLTSAVEELVARARALSDAELRLIADARREVDEAFHEGALAAAAEALAGRGEDYVRARILLRGAHVPGGLESATGEDRARWQEVSRLARLAVDDALLALLTSDVLHPKHVRELYRSFRALDP